MAEKYKHYYVPQILVKNWAADGKHASWYNPMIQKRIENGNITRYFHENLVDIPDEIIAGINNLDAFFKDVLSYLLDGEVDCLKLDEAVSPREAIIFMLLRAPMPLFSLDNMLERMMHDLTALFSRSKKGKKEELRSEEIKRAFNQMAVYGLDLLDMEAVILSAPEGSSFVLGTIPVTCINPYFSGAKPDSFPGVQAFEKWGSVLVLPLTPEKALCIYDPETYTVEDNDGFCSLKKKDVDMLNSAALYNSNDIGGVIHVCGEDYLNDLYGKLDDEDYFREASYLGGEDEFPFSTKLSVLKVRKEAEEKREERMKSFLREYISNLVDYDDKNYEKIHGENAVKEFTKRYRYAVRMLKTIRKKKTAGE